MGVVVVEMVPWRRSLKRDSFNCGKPELDRWLKEQAGQQERRYNTRTFAAVPPGDDVVVGYYATCTYRIEPDATAVSSELRRTYPIPAILLARFAVDQGWAGCGIGRQMLVDALERMVDVSRNVGCEVVVVHAIDQEAVTFYARYGFRQVDSDPLRLYLPMKDIEATLSS